MHDFVDALCSWYEEHKRDLPWRRTNDPYAVWVSEVMLQQTRVETVIPYFLRFMHAFPTVFDLAGSQEEEYMKLWEGLGYYSRVRNLVEGAKYIIVHHQGILPCSKEELLKVKGIGEYTASAILSIAFKQKEIAVDGNLIRVYARLEKMPIVPNEPSSVKRCRDFFQPFLEEGDPSIFNQALMDLGELVCLPNGAPRCNECPLRDFCKARKEGNALDYPLPKAKANKRVEHRLVLFLIYENKVVIRKRGNNGLLANMYEFPNYLIEGDSIEKTLQKSSFYCKTPIFLEKKKHIFTHIVYEMEGYVILLEEPPREGILVPMRELKERYTLPNAFSKFLPSLETRYLR